MDVTRPLFPNTGGNYTTPNVFKRCSLNAVCCLCVWRLYLNVSICTLYLTTLNSEVSQRGELNKEKPSKTTSKVKPKTNQRLLIRRQCFTTTQDLSSRHEMYKTQHPRRFAMWEWDWAKRGKPQLPGRRWWERLWSPCKVRMEHWCCVKEKMWRGHCCLRCVVLLYATVQSDDG